MKVEIQKRSGRGSMTSNYLFSNSEGASLKIASTEAAQKSAKLTP